MMSLRDYEAMFDQMAKMKMNRILFFHFENEPFIDYTYQGERKLIGDISHPVSGFISYGRHFTGSFRVKDLPVGRDKFDRDKIAPLEFQDVSSSDEALDRGRTFMQRLDVWTCRTRFRQRPSIGVHLPPIGLPISCLTACCSTPATTSTVRIRT